MRRFDQTLLILLAIFIVPCAMISFCAPTTSAPAVWELPQAQKTVLIRHVEGGAGSGIPIHVDPLGFTLILMCRHVAMHAKTLDDMVVVAGEVTLPICRIELCPDKDAALIWVQTRLPIVPIEWDDMPDFGDRVQAAGFMFGNYLTLSEGLVSIPGTASIDILPGCSGGPVLRNDRLVGIIQTCMVVYGTPVGSTSDFVQISDIEPWLRAMLGA